MRKDSPPKPMTFMQWLKTQEPYKDAIGKLAKFVRKDPEFPKNGSLLEKRLYLLEKKVKQETMEAFDIATHEYWIYSGNVK